MSSCCRSLLIQRVVVVVVDGCFGVVILEPIAKSQITLDDSRVSLNLSTTRPVFPQSSRVSSIRRRDGDAAALRQCGFVVIYMWDE